MRAAKFEDISNHDDLMQFLDAVEFFIISLNNSINDLKVT